MDVRRDKQHHGGRKEGQESRLTYEQEVEEIG